MYSPRSTPADGGPLTENPDFHARIARLSETGDSLERVETLLDLADTILFGGEAGPVIETVEEAIAMARRLGHAHHEGRGLFYLGAANWLVTRLEPALAALLEADAIFRNLQDAEMQARVHYFIGSVYRSLGDLDQAFLEGLEPVEFFAASLDHKWEARARLGLAMTLHELADFEGARKQFETILEILAHSGEQWVVGRALTGLGAVFAALGDHREALRYHLRALKTCESAGHTIGEARSLHDLGQLYEHLGDRAKAVEFYTKSLRLREEIDQKEAQCTSLIALGTLLAGEDSEVALGYLRRALEVAEEIGAKPRIQNAHLALSRFHERLGDAARALEHYRAFHDAYAEVARFTSGMRVKNLRTLFEAEKKNREAEIARLKESLDAGTSLGSYRLIERLGEGGMGEVWRCEHRLLARPAAIKLIRAHASGGRDHEQLVQRFRREAEVTSRLASPHTVQLFDYGVSDAGTFHYVMELLEGMDLKVMVDSFGPLPESRLVYLLCQACRSLAEAHARGLVHRDIKPANLFVSVAGGEPDFLKILDFGIAKTGPEDDSQLTAVGNVVGTPAFIAPEWVTGEGTPDGRADIYSLGCTAFWALTGRTVFQGKTPTAVLMAHVTSPPPPMTRADGGPITPGLEEIIRACLEKKPENRPASAEDLRRRLESIGFDPAWTESDAREWWSDKVSTRPGRVD